VDQVFIFSLVFSCLLCLVTAEQEEVDRLEIADMVKKELRWLQEAQLPPSPCYGFQTLMAGHLRLCAVLFSFERVDTGKGWVRVRGQYG